jgi:hypothetical protein
MKKNVHSVHLLPSLYGHSAKKARQRVARTFFEITPCIFIKDVVYYPSAYGAYNTPAGVMGSDATAACGGNREQSEWQRSIADEAVWRRGRYRAPQQEKPKAKAHITHLPV